MLPLVADWARKIRVPPSRVMIPLGYATILGGLCTVIGASANMVVNGLVVSQARLPSLHLFDVAWVGGSDAGVGIAYLLLIACVLLPDQGPAVSIGDDPRQYTVEMLVEPGSRLAGQTVGQTGLPHLPGLYLLEINSQQTTIGRRDFLKAGEEGVSCASTLPGQAGHRLRGGRWTKGRRPAAAERRRCIFARSPEALHCTATIAMMQRRQAGAVPQLPAWLPAGCFCLLPLPSSSPFLTMTALSRIKPFCPHLSPRREKVPGRHSSITSDHEVVNDVVKSSAMGLPNRSFTPVSPPRTRRV
jgi:hypothetical protein